MSHARTRFVLDRTTLVALAAGTVVLQLLVFSAGFLLGAADGVQALTPPVPAPKAEIRLASLAGGGALSHAMEPDRALGPSDVEPVRLPVSRPAPIRKVVAAVRKESKPSQTRPSPLAAASFLVSTPKIQARRPSTPVRSAPRLPRSAQAYAAMIREAAARHSLSPALVEAIARVESGFNPRAVSHKGARGLMQVMPSTGRRFGVHSDRLFDPEHNLSAGVAYLAWLSRRYEGNLDFIIAAYNAGEGAVDDHGGIPPYRETQSYVRRVRAALRSIEKREFPAPDPASPERPACSARVRPVQTDDPPASAGAPPAPAGSPPSCADPG